MKLYPSNLTDKIGFEIIKEATSTFAVSDLAKDWALSVFPSSKKDRVELLQKQTSEMIDVERDTDALPINELPDIESYLNQSKAKGSLIPLSAFVDILVVLSTSRFVKNFLKSRSENKPTLFALGENLIPLKEIEKEIRGKVSEQGSLKDDASPELQSIRRNLNKKRGDLRTAINRVMSKASKDGMTSDEGATIRNGRMVIPVLAEYKRKIQGFVHDVSSTGQTVYLEPVEALQLNNEIRQLEIEEQHEIERILKELTNYIRQNRKYIQQNYESLAEFDLIRAKARLSIKINGIIPILSESFDVHLKKTFNPHLLLKNMDLKKEDQENIIPLDLELLDDERCLVITGPNAGGKSVAMKTLGLCAIMNQSGYGIPAYESSELPVFKGIFVDMGDDQSIENDLSTFSSRLQWIRETQRELVEYSLVLIDEAASGTDPDEGSALYQAFLEKTCESPVKTILTTHHGGLKIFAHEFPMAINGSMEFDQATLSPTYVFKKGVPGSSYAFEIAQRMKLDADLLERARQLTGESKNKMESLITELEKKNQEAEDFKRRHQSIYDKSEAQKNRYEDKMKILEREREKIRTKALKEAKSIMDNANQRIEEAVQKIVEQKEYEKERVKEIREDVKELHEEIDQELEVIEETVEEVNETEPPVIGDHVKFKDGHTSGELIEVKGKNAVVQADGLRIKTKFKNLVKTAAPKKQRQSRARSNVIIGDSSFLDKLIKPSLDLRGKRADDALNEVTHYLDSAIFRGLNQVELIHGRGDGILKDQIHRNLKKRTDIKRYYLSDEDQGGAGCTIVVIQD